uniref:F-box domain-containing protein n=1 Tax=Psilocybe cubensis TaxID=181762 RepID=A0A8H8CGN7_PSICU
MRTILDIPPEILAAAFEMGIYSTGIRFIYPVALVCRDWCEIVNDTPRLWGILFIGRKTSPKILQRRLEKAKASPLSIMVSSKAPIYSKNLEGPLKDLVALSRNWVALDANFDFISLVRWKDLCRNLEELTLFPGRKYQNSQDTFFDDVDPSSVDRDVKLHSLTATSLPHLWIRGFLGPKVRHLTITGAYESTENEDRDLRHRTMNIRDTIDFLKRVPHATSIALNDLNHTDPIGYSPPVVRLQKLQRLELNGVLFSSTILSSVSAPCLQTLSLNNDRDTWDRFSPPIVPMASFLSQWSQPGFTPTHLHTLDLINCLALGDIPFLIRWLGKLPNLVQFFLVDDDNVHGNAALQSLDPPSSLENEQNDLLYALAHPLFDDDGKGMWLCPSLMVLRIDPAADMKGLLSIAHARGGIATYSYDANMVPPPSRLREIRTHLCSITGRNDIDQLNSLMDQVYCSCLDCGLSV